MVLLLFLHINFLAAVCLSRVDWGCYGPAAGVAFYFFLAHFFHQSKRGPSASYAQPRVLEHLMQRRGSGSKGDGIESKLKEGGGKRPLRCNGDEPLQRFMPCPGKEPQEGDGFGPPSAPDLKPEHDQAATAGTL